MATAAEIFTRHTAAVLAINGLDAVYSGVAGADLGVRILPLQGVDEFTQIGGEASARALHIMLDLAEYPLRPIKDDLFLIDGLTFGVADIIRDTGYHMRCKMRQITGAGALITWGRGDIEFNRADITFSTLYG